MTIKGLPNPAKLPELQLEFDDQIAENRIPKVPVFKISLDSIPSDFCHFSSLPPPPPTLERMVALRLVACLMFMWENVAVF